MALVACIVLIVLINFVFKYFDVFNKVRIYKVTFSCIYLLFSSPQAKFKRIWARSQILDAAQTWLVSLEIVFSVSRFKPVLNWNQFMVVQQGGLNSSNSATDEVNPWNFIFYCLTKDQRFRIKIFDFHNQFMNLEKFGKIIFRVHLSLSLI